MGGAWRGIRGIQAAMGVTMSRALLVMAYRRARGQQPDDAELTEFLAALASMCGGEYLYIPKRPQANAIDAEICRLRDSGLGYREIAARLRCSQATVARALRQRELLSISPYDGSGKSD